MWYYPIGAIAAPLEPRSQAQGHTILHTHLPTCCQLTLAGTATLVWGACLPQSAVGSGFSWQKISGSASYETLALPQEIVRACWGPHGNLTMLNQKANMTSLQTMTAQRIITCSNNWVNHIHHLVVQRLMMRMAICLSWGPRPYIPRSYQPWTNPSGGGCPSASNAALAPASWPLLCWDRANK